MRAPIHTKHLTKNTNGFTIIEIMIVLAVAALIMLIVFLAVPGLERSARNTQRTSDATKVAAAVDQCMSDNNDVVANCDTTAQLTGSSGALDTTSLKQLTTVVASASSPGTVTFPSGTNEADVYFGEKCSAAGNSAGSSGANADQAVVVYNEEGGSGSIPRCVNA